ncbi:hypothetical protein [Draconibacterium halophilum]|uniref:Uncharacterized protein n=1 Tax=Draconibacterium halophilum TaxID=2706887 RepID=A0A6C0RHH6_9BACT|nr:hypothetical protein [Draconibacterium halophilum]QIA09282.1 hypothetical protein G0Q07_16895 [Draconibacterium halophilum]
MYNEDRNFDTDKLLKEAFTKAPEYSLPDNFTDTLVEKVEKRFAWQQYLREFLIYLAVILGIMVVGAVLAFVWYDVTVSGLLAFLTANALLVVGGNLLLVFVLFADRVLLRYFMYRAELKGIGV